MQALRWDDDELAHFVVTEVRPEYHGALADLAYRLGPQGFERAFPKDLPGIDFSFERFATCVEQMVRQTAGQAVVPWEDALVRVSQLLAQDGLGRWLAGSAALAVRGVDVFVRDVDLVVDESRVGILDRVLGEYVVEPTRRKVGWIADYFGRAFVGARVEWVAGVSDTVDIPEPTDFGPFAASRLEDVVWRGMRFQVPPLDLQLAMCRRRGLMDRVKSIEAFRI